MRKFAGVLMILSSFVIFGAIFLNLDDWVFLGIDLDVFLGVSGLIGVLLGFVGTIYAILRERKTNYPDLRLHVFTLHKKEHNGQTMLYIAASAVGFGDVPELDDPKIVFENGEIVSFQLTQPPIITKGGKQHSYFVGALPTGHTNATGCFMYSYVTQRGYFSKSFPHAHRLYRLRKRYEPPIIIGELETDMPGHSLNGQDVQWARHIEYEELLTRWEQAARLFHKVFRTGKEFPKQLPL